MVPSQERQNRRKSRYNRGKGKSRYNIAHEMMNQDTNNLIYNTQIFLLNSAFPTARGEIYSVAVKSSCIKQTCILVYQIHPCLMLGNSHTSIGHLGLPDFPVPHLDKPADGRGLLITKLRRVAEDDGIDKCDSLPLSASSISSGLRNFFNISEMCIGK